MKRNLIRQHMTRHRCASNLYLSTDANLRLTIMHVTVMYVLSLAGPAFAYFTLRLINVVMSQRVYRGRASGSH